MRYSLKLLTPMHIGAGERYGYEEVVKRGRWRYRLDPGKVLPLLSPKEFQGVLDDLEEGRYEDFKQLVNQKVPDLKGAAHYRFSVDEATENELKEGGRREIQAHIKTLNQPYLPGSSLKGCLRNAIMFGLWNGQVEKEVKEILLSRRNPGSKKMDLERALQPLFADPSVQRRRLPNYDLHRFVGLSDSEPLSDGSLILRPVATVEALEGSGFKWFGHGDGGTHEYLELLPDDTILEGELRLGGPSHLLTYLRLGDRTQSLELEWLQTVLHNFARAIMDHELRFYHRYGEKARDEFKEITDYQIEYYEWLKKQTTPSNPCIRLGHGSGLLSLTLALKLKDDSQAYDALRRLARTRHNEFEFPKSRKLWVGDGEAQTPIGWARLEVTE